jgi:hypothetical protein
MANPTFTTIFILVQNFILLIERCERKSSKKQQKKEKVVGCHDFNNQNDQV